MSPGGRGESVIGYLMGFRRLSSLLCRLVWQQRWAGSQCTCKVGKEEQTKTIRNWKLKSDITSRWYLMISELYPWMDFCIGQAILRRVVP